MLALAATAAAAPQGSHRGLMQDAGQPAGQPTGQPTEQAGGQSCVVLNEIVNKPQDFGDQEGVDFLELKSNCGEAMDLAGWSFADENFNQFFMGQDGCEHIIGAGGYLVFFRENKCSFDFGFTGKDNATLLDASGSVKDFTSWESGQADEGFSWARIPDGSGAFQTAKPTPGIANTA